MKCILNVLIFKFLNILNKATLVDVCFIFLKIL